MMKIFTLVCAVAAGCALSAVALPLSTRIQPVVESTAGQSSHRAHACSDMRHAAAADGFARLRAVDAAETAEWWNYKNFEYYQKVGDEWVLAQTNDREIDPVTGNVIKDHIVVIYGTYPDDLKTQHQLREYEYDQYGRTVSEYVSVGDTEESMTLRRREITEHWDDTRMESPVKAQYYQFTPDNGISWTDKSPTYRMDIERDAEGRETRISCYSRDSYEPDHVPVELTMYGETDIEYGEDGLPSVITNHSLFNGTTTTTKVSEIEWLNYDPASVYNLEFLTYRVPWTPCGSTCKHAVFTTTDNDGVSRIFASDVVVDGDLTTVTYERRLEGAEITDYGEVQCGRRKEWPQPNGGYNTYQYNQNYVPGEDWFQYDESLVGATFLPVVYFGVESFQIVPGEESSSYPHEVDAVFYGYHELSAEITYDEASGMVHEYVTPGVIHTGKVFTGAEDGFESLVGIPFSEWPEVYDFETVTRDEDPVKRVWKNWVKASDAIDGVAVDNSAAPVEWFTIDGRRVADPGQGLYIRRQGTQASKVVRR